MRMPEVFDRPPTVLQWDPKPGFGGLGVDGFGPEKRVWTHIPPSLSGGY